MVSRLLQTRSQETEGVAAAHVASSKAMSKLSELRPAIWGETMADTLSALREEGEWHTTESQISDLLDKAALDLTERRTIEHLVAQLRARAIIVGAAYEAETEKARSLTYRPIWGWN